MCGGMSPKNRTAMTVATYVPREPWGHIDPFSGPVIVSSLGAVLSSFGTYFFILLGRSLIMLCLWGRGKTRAVFDSLLVGLWADFYLEFKHFFCLFVSER